MAFTAAGSGSGGRGRKRRNTSSLAEMNIVPLVDVVLVLLIIFMVTASAMEFGLEIEVPEVTSSRTSVEELPVVGIARGGELYLNDQAVNINALGDSVHEKFEGAEAVYLRTDKTITAEVLLQVVDALSKSGFKVNLVTRAADLAPKGR